MAEATEGKGIYPQIEEQNFSYELDKTWYLTELGRISVSSVACSTKPHAWGNAASCPSDSTALRYRFPRSFQ
jgi:hypothetical protein